MVKFFPFGSDSGGGGGRGEDGANQPTASVSTLPTEVLLPWPRRLRRRSHVRLSLASIFDVRHLIRSSHSDARALGKFFGGSINCIALNEDEATLRE